MKCCRAADLELHPRYVNCRYVKKLSPEKTVQIFKFNNMKNENDMVMKNGMFALSSQRNELLLMNTFLFL